MFVRCSNSISDIL